MSVGRRERVLALIIILCVGMGDLLLAPINLRMCVGRRDRMLVLINNMCVCV